MWELINAFGVTIAIFTLMMLLIATVVAMENHIDED